MPPAVSLAVLTSLASVPPLAGTDEVDGLRVPPGFVVTEFAGSDLANDIQCMTIDPRGRVIVSGRGYTRILVDDDGDGLADRALPFADGPKDGAMGLHWEGDSLLVVGDDGLRRYVDADDDGIADGPPELILPIKASGEHDAHAVRRGPDGWLYVMVGNFADVDASYASLPTSPIAEPVAGCLIRIAPDGSGTEIVADGFRNAYDFDFGPDGEVFTYDSDNERCVWLPWYEPTRLYHVVPGGNHGWLGPQQTDLWRLPPEVEDVVPPAASLDRGSPTGVVCYRHTALPERYHNGLFFLDWTFGRVYFARPQREGASYTAEPEVFLEATGTQGFAWTDAEVHPHTGDLYLSIGGRGTRGAVYRVTYVGDEHHTQSARNHTTEAVPPPHTPGPADSLLPPGVIGPEVPTPFLLEAAASPDPSQRHRALLALRRRQHSIPQDDLIRVLLLNADHPDRLIRQAVASWIAALDAESLALLSKSDQLAHPRARLTLGFGLARRNPEESLAIAAAILDDPDAPADLLLPATRLAQVALGGQPHPDLKATVWEGYSAPRDASNAENPSAIEHISNFLLRDDSRSGPLALDRERTRLLALLAVDDPAAIDLMADRLTDSSDPIDDLHHLIVLGRLRGPRPEPVTRATAETLLALDRKLDALNARRDRNWPLRVSELVRGLAERDPDLLDTLLRHPEFGRPDHALFARAEGFDRATAAGRFLDHAESDPDFAWTTDVIAVVASHPTDRARTLLRSLWGQQGLDESILPALARDPIAEDRPKFLAGLRSSQVSTRSAALDALQHLGPSDDPREWLALIQALRQSPDAPTRSRIAGRLEQSTRQAFGPDPGPWADWFAAHHPEHAAALSGADGVDVAAWSRRLAAIDWDLGDASRGQALFDRTQCSACHSGNRAVGPDLSGIGGRFSRDDLFTAIVQPSRDIADRYRSLIVATHDGGIYQGIVIYDAVDSLILQTGPTETLRIDGNAIEERRPSDLSLMPAGLIDELSDQEIADLDAYLRSL